MKILRLIAFVSTALGALIIITASGLLAFHHCACGSTHPLNLFQVASSFLLLAIAIFIVTKNCECSCCKTGEEKKNI